MSFNFLFYNHFYSNEFSLVSCLSFLPCLAKAPCLNVIGIGMPVLDDLSQKKREAFCCKSSELAFYLGELLYLSCQTNPLINSVGGYLGDDC